MNGMYWNNIFVRPAGALILCLTISGLKPPAMQRCPHPGAGVRTHKIRERINFLKHRSRSFVQLPKPGSTHTIEQ